jgi:hypothetical protein
MKTHPRFSLRMPPAAAPLFPRRLHLHLPGRSRQGKPPHEFRSGADLGKVIDKIVSENRLLFTAMRNPADAPLLKSKRGYIAKDSHPLEAALNTSSGTETRQEGAEGAAGGATVQLKTS